MQHKTHTCIKNNKYCLQEQGESIHIMQACIEKINICNAHENYDDDDEE